MIARTNQHLQEVAANDHPVFITGEVGTEKAFAAKLVHQLSARAHNPVTKVSVSWKLPPDLAQYFERCAGGSLIIHLQKEFPIDMQYTLVEVASDGCFADSMSGEVVDADVRIILMTSLDLETLAARTPLLPELKELLVSQHIEIPSLRDRLEDIPALVRYALKRAHDTGRTKATAVDPQVLTLFRHWDWPGNAEDLLLVTAQAAITAETEVVTLDDLPGTFMDQMDAETLLMARSVRSPEHFTTQRSSKTHVETREPREPVLADPPTGQPEEEYAHAAETQRFDPAKVSAQALSQLDTGGAPLADPPTGPGLFDDGDEVQDVALNRVLSMARRLHAQSLLLKKQMSGPLDQSESPIPFDQLAALSSDHEVMHALEDELDRGLEMVHALRRQMAILNIRQQQSAETVRDVIQQLSLIRENPSDLVDRKQLQSEAAELTASLGKIDEIIQRVSKEIPTFGSHVEGLFEENSEDTTLQ